MTINAGKTTIREKIITGDKKLNTKNVFLSVVKELLFILEIINLLINLKVFVKNNLARINNAVINNNVFNIDCSGESEKIFIQIKIWLSINIGGNFLDALEDVKHIEDKKPAKNIHNKNIILIFWLKFMIKKLMKF